MITRATFYTRLLKNPKEYQYVEIKIQISFVLKSFTKMKLTQSTKIIQK